MTLFKNYIKRATLIVFSVMGLGFLSPIKAQEITGLEGFTIFIDQGHSRKENGGAYGYTEAEKTLRIGLELQRQLNERTDIDSAYVARTNDSQLVSLTQRTDRANSLNVDFYYSIHSDAGSTTANSTLMLYGGWRVGGVIYEKNPKGGGDFAEIMNPILTSAMKVTTRGNYADRTFYDASHTHNNRYPYLHVNRESNMASMLSEAGFHTNSYQNQRNMSASYKLLEARAAFWTVLEYLGVERPVEGILTGEIKDYDTETFANGVTITVQGKSDTTDTYEKVFYKYTNNDSQLRNGYYYIDGLEPGPAQVIIGGDNYESDTLDVVLKETEMTFLNATIKNNLLPIVESTVPEEGGVVNPGNSKIIIRFNKKMDQQSVENVLSITPEVEYSLRWLSARSLEISTSEMEFESEYTLTIGEGPFEDSPSKLPFDGDGDGEPGGDFILNYVTGNPDITAPKVTDMNPFNVTVPTNETPINITFDELLNHSTLDNSSVHLEATGLDNVTGTVLVFDAGERSAISFFPDTELEYNTRYNIVLNPGYTDLAGNEATAVRKAFFNTGGDKYGKVVNIHDFENGLSPFWEPSQSGSTTGEDPDHTGIAATNEYTNLSSGSTSAMRINYGFTGEGTGLLRIHNPNTTPKFNKDYILQAYVFGDGSGNKVRFVVRDANGELEGHEWVTLDWIGWRIVRWNMSKDTVIPFANGDGVLNGNLNLDSFQVGFEPGQQKTGFIVIDDIQAVTLENAVSIEDEWIGDLPTKLSLEQNYPNPFNPTTNIKFDLPAKSEVHLEVFDMLGRKVETIFSGTKTAGSHQVTFDARNLSSGVYIYRLSVNNKMLTKKMLLMK